MKKTLIAASLLAFTSGFANAADYVIDTKGAHASINFKVKHLGYSWLTGRFDDFSGTFSYDPAHPEASKISVTIDPESVNSNHAERDKHIRSGDFLDVSKYTNASFTSTKIEDLGDGKLKVYGDFTLHGTTKPIVINAEKIGEGDDPWGGYRAGFSGTTSFEMADYGLKMNMGTVEMTLHIEGIKQ